MSLRSSMKIFKWLKMPFSKSKNNEKTLDLIVDLDDRGKVLLDEFLELTQENADDIMVPRPAICGLPIDGNLEKTIAIVKAQPFSRYPVYGDGIDDIRGFVHIRDIAISQLSKEPFHLETLLQKVLVVPESLSILNLLEKFNESRIHMAVVVDEYGSTNGLVTASDILRHLLGETLEETEFNGADVPLHWISDRSVVITGSYDMDDLLEETILTLTPEEDAQDPGTLNGYIQLLAGRVPDRMEVLTNHQGIEFHALEVTPRSVLKVKMTHPTVPLKK